MKTTDIVSKVDELGCIVIHPGLHKILLNQTIEKKTLNKCLLGRDNIEIWIL
ncbi:hypothetical protein DJ91_5576 [Priestia megaterium]|uniref:Uncharacterized protein n=1 Tax=Priestia megaterium (strain ATCC 14581 / DSM 32 / CCUG 1817 / JCM 2506 / NBRC 15308 / NCIMB 9376 / NCTC 10342 / NRRL B-14308 / VKM B-512 / Ford 19) TaxID=1348623 RepID=A0A0B6AYW1_PRIM2|nr:MULTISPECIES: hypothetical protein [Priestia]AJI25868.1 hypothetical protein BG04_5774 [Priestia megaterium NBRC 15308 = ATCC 14581]KFM95457.1 hypothetical protein DJ91_5576 [Priestia megaterium]MED3821987.1 hypothetical protein [Priestia aryabhattai]MED4399110.1 hypothetical protein [Priestia megaterium]NER44932.1 hypothetical protein [Priestia megaterium NBRC 15308 = ATCC 14581]